MLVGLTMSTQSRIPFPDSPSSLGSPSIRKRDGDETTWSLTLVDTSADISLPILHTHSGQDPDITDFAERERPPLSS